MARVRSNLPAWMLGALASAVLWLGVPDSARSLQAPSDLADLDEDDEAALETIATHSPELRDAALRASLHVDALVETQRIQDRTSAAFRDRIDALDREGQEQMWELVREPGLVEELASAEPSAAQLDAIAARYPDALAPAIRELGARHHALLVEVAGLERDARERFETVIADLPEPTQKAFRELVRQPELLTLLAKQVRLAVYLGDSYRADPEGTREHLDALAEQVAQRNRESEQNWVEAIDDDPQAAEELAASARAYATEQGYDYDELTQPEVKTTINVVVRPYPYWFGYPYWYSDFAYYPWGYWYPYPLHFGFYFRGGSAFFFGLPSVGFLSWYYRGPTYAYYPKLSNCFVRHGKAHPHARSHAHRAVRHGYHGDAHGSRRGWNRGGGRGWDGGGDRASRRDGQAFAGRGRGDFFVRRSSGWSRGGDAVPQGSRWHRERPAAETRGGTASRGGDRRDRPDFRRGENRRERGDPDRAGPGPRRRDERAQPPRERREERRGSSVIVHRGNEGGPREGPHAAPRAAPDRERARDRDRRRDSGSFTTRDRDRRRDSGSFTTRDREPRRNDRDRATRGRERQRIEVRGPAVSGDGPRARPAQRTDQSLRAAPSDRGGAGMRGRVEVPSARRAPGPRMPTAQQSGRRGGPRVPGNAGGRSGMRGRR